MIVLTYCTLLYLAINCTDEDEKTFIFVNEALAFSIVATCLNAQINSSIINRFIQVKFKAGAEFIPGDCFYVLTSGSACRLTEDTKTVLGMLEPGNSFGELSLMYGTESKEWVRCKEDV